MDHVSHAHIRVEFDISRGQEHIQVDIFRRSVAVDQLDGAAAGRTVMEPAHPAHRLASYILLDGPPPQIVQIPSCPLDQIRDARGRLHDETSLAQHRSGDVNREEAHAHQRNRDFNAGVLGPGGIEDELLYLGQRVVGNPESFHRGNDHIPFGCHLELIGQIELPPDVELQHIARTDDVGVRIDLAILADAQPFHIFSGGQANSSAERLIFYTQPLSPGELLQLRLFLLALFHQLFQRILGAERGHPQPQAESEQSNQPAHFAELHLFLLLNSTFPMERLSANHSTDIRECNVPLRPWIQSGSSGKISGKLPIFLTHTDRQQRG